MIIYLYRFIDKQTLCVASEGVLSKKVDVYLKDIFPEKIKDIICNVYEIQQIIDERYWFLNLEFSYIEKDINMDKEFED